MPGMLDIQPDQAIGASLIPRVLVADDDPASRRFLGDGLRSLGAQPHLCADGSAALACARGQDFDLLLLDCRMPGAGALQILKALRSDTAAASHATAAVATSAEVSPTERQQLIASGFCEVLLKPCDLRTLQQVLVLTQPAGSGMPVLDDAAALVCSGDAQTMQALRGLLREELVLLERDLDALRAEPALFTDRLHRLRSSCGFCGAAVLGAHIARLQQALTFGIHALPLPLQRFRHALRETLAALDPPR